MKLGVPALIGAGVATAAATIGATVALEWTRGITIDRSPEEIWPWSAQMGYGRGGWYTPEAFDRWANRWLWRSPEAYRSSPWRLLPEYQHVAVGELIPDGPDYGAYFRVMDVLPGRHLVLWSLRHPLRPHPVDPTDAEALRHCEEEVRSGGTWLEFSWAFVLRPAGARTRLLVRCRANLARLRGVKVRAERAGERERYRRWAATSREWAVMAEPCRAPVEAMRV